MFLSLQPFPVGPGHRTFCSPQRRFGAPASATDASERYKTRYKNNISALFVKAEWPGGKAAIGS
jgi:hypothetical protein